MLHRLGGVEPALALQHVAEILAADELHDQIGATVGERAVVVDGDDRRMLQARDDLRLAPEPAPGLRVVQEVRAHDLERDEAIEAHVARPVDGAHPAAPRSCSIRYLLSTVRGTAGTGFSAVPSAGQCATPASSQRPHFGHSIIGSTGGVTALMTRVRSVSSSRVAADAPAEPGDVEAERHLRGDAGEQLPILGGVGLFRPPLAERDERDERAVLADDRDEEDGARALEPLAFLRRAAGGPVSADRSARSRAGRRTTAASRRGRLRGGGARRCRAAR